MFKKVTFLTTLVGFGFLLGSISGAIASEMTTEHAMSDSPQATQFRRIEQPLINKIAVTLGGLGLIGLEIWWFLLSKPTSQKLELHSGIQEVTVTVDGGYTPSHIVVQAGQMVRLNFLRRDPSNCLEEVRLPDFRIAQHLPLNKSTTVEFMPIQPGSYEFACGMNMFRGVVEVQTAAQAPDSASQIIEEISTISTSEKTSLHLRV